MPPTIHPSKHPESSLLDSIRDHRASLRLGALPVVIRFKNWWHHGPSKWVTFLDIFFFWKFGEFEGLVLGWFWLGWLLLVGFVGFGWVGWFGFGLFVWVGFIFNWGTGLLGSLLEGWFVLVGLFWLSCFGWFVQLSKLRYVFSCLW